MMKKILFLLTALIVVLALVACGGPADETLPGGEETDPPAEHVHAYEDVITPATCTTAGLVESKCECGDVQSTSEIPLADHTASALDCEKDTVCTVCNTVLAEKTGHTVVSSEIISQANCTTAGKEQGACVTCGKIIATEIPAIGHVPASGAALVAVDGGFSTTCSVCSQNVVVKAQEPALILTFDEDIETEFAKSDLGLELKNPADWKLTDFNGSKAVFVAGNKPIYINIADPAKLTALGTFVISFDYATTKESAAGSMGSAFSILNNSYGGVQTALGSIGWGWIFKIIEDADKIATVNALGSLSDANSIAVERNTKYNIQIVASPASDVYHVFVNGTYIGASNSKSTPALSKVVEKNSCFRFGDGPDCGHVFDNFAISALK